MLINISISALIASSFSNSPFFSMRGSYKLDSCQFNRFFPIVFFQTQKLDVYNTYFTKLQSGLIITATAENEIYDNSNFPSSINDDINFLHCRFHNIINVVSEIHNSITSFNECVFYKIKNTNSNLLAFFMIYSQQIDFSGCCFSELELKNFLTCSGKGKELKFDSSIFTTTILEKELVDSNMKDFKCKQCNFSSITCESDIFKFQLMTQAHIDGTQIAGSKALTLVYALNSEGSFEVSSSYFYDDEIGYKETGHSIFFLSVNYILISDSIFDEFSTKNAGQTLTLFAPITTLTQNVTLVHNFFSFIIFNYISMTRAVNSHYIDNNLLNSPYPSDPVPINSYLYNNYRKECQIYIYPTTVFTESSQFTASSLFSASSDFSPSNYFITASPSPSASKSPSSSPTLPPTPSASPSVSVTYGVIGAVGTAVVSFGISSLIWLAIRNFCIYDHNNYLHMDV